MVDRAEQYNTVLDTFDSIKEMNLKRRICSTFLLTVSSISLASSVADAQNCSQTAPVRATQLVGVAADYLRLQEISDTSLVSARLTHRLSDNATNVSCRGKLWSDAMAYSQTLVGAVTLVPLSVAATSNSAFPVDRNNGSLWAGRGLSAIAQGGLILRLGPLSVGAVPEVTYQQNKEFVLLPAIRHNPYFSGLYTQIDLPQRFGPDAYSTVTAGQSYIRVDVRNVGVGFSNENLWWGPGVSNTTLLTNTAPGFPHVFVNSRKPFNIGIGRLGLEAFWGKTSESKYFDSDPSNDHDMVAASLITYEPRGTRGLTLAVARTFTLPWDSVGTRTLTRFAQPFFAKSLSSSDNPNGHSIDDQRISFMGRYVLPASEFELYGEWAREDASWDLNDFIGEPEHGSGHIFGFQKGFNRTAESVIRFYAEATNLQPLRQERSFRSSAPFYLHIPHGHTQQGQLLGASIGPGGESQLLGVDFFRRWGLAGLFLERVRRDEFSRRAQYFWSTEWPPLHDVEITAGVRWTRQFGPMRFDGSFSTGKRRNRNFLRDETNRQLNAAFTWAPGS